MESAMMLTKHAHACVVVSTFASSLVIDPGTFTPDVADVLKSVDAVLITHDHFDHVDEAAVAAALTTRPSLSVYAPAAVAAKLPFDSVTVVTGGEEFAVGDITVRSLSGRHAVIHADIPQIDDIGYLVGGTVFHPGDAYLVPGVPVDTLLLPTSGPWTKLGEAVDYVRAVAPNRVVQIHELMLSELGQKSTANFIGADGLTGIPFVILQPGESLTAPSTEVSGARHEVRDHAAR
jgi:L-ascorbate metabolism protein UlaG (beta-lactamase superfamily)